MPTLAELLSPEDARMIAAVVHPEPKPLAQPGSTTKPRRERNWPEPDVARTCDCTRRPDGHRTLDTGETVHNACGRRLPTASILKGVTITPPNTTARNKMIDIDTITDQQLGALVRKSMKAERVEPLVEAAAEATTKRERKAAKAKAVKAQERADLVAIGTLPGFTFKSVEVPALDVTSIANIDEVPAARFRSPYNKIRNRMGEDLHPTGREPGSPSSTWKDLINDHQRFAPLALEEAKATHVALLTQDKPAKKGKKAIAVEIDLDEKAKVKALRKAMDCTKAEARAMLAAIS